jgi:DUF3047 family protein
VKRALPVALLAAAIESFAQESVAVPAFSAATPGGALPAGWDTITLPHAKSARFELVRDEGRTVLRVTSENAFGTVAHALSADPAQAPILAWRWKIDRVVNKANLETKEGEDFAARVYVSFEYPLDELAFAARAKLALARAFYAFVPAAAICYVWDNDHATGTSRWSPHFDYVRVVVVESGNARAGQWVEERRDVDADFRAAFGARWAKPTPRIVAIVAGNDTDQTGESATAWFGDFKLEPRR